MKKHINDLTDDEVNACMAVEAGWLPPSHEKTCAIRLRDKLTHSTYDDSWANPEGYLRRSHPQYTKEPNLWWPIAEEYGIYPNKEVLGVKWYCCLSVDPFVTREVYETPGLAVCKCFLFIKHPDGMVEVPE